MKTATKIGIVIVAAIFLGITSIPIIHFINRQWVLSDVESLLMKEGYRFDQLGFSDISGFLKRKYPTGTIKADIQKTFKDCDSTNSFEYNDEDSLKRYHEEDYVYKVGFWGVFEVRAIYDSTSALKVIDYYFSYSHYDDEYE